MADEKKIYDYIASYAGEKGIITLDVGTLKESTEKWETVTHICEPRFEQLHKLVSKCYVSAEKFKGKQPINYLYHYWKDSDSREEVIVYSFDSSGFVEKKAYSKDSSTPKYNTIVEDNSNSCVSVPESELCVIENNLNKIIKESPEPAESFKDTEDEFKFYQSIFTKMVLSAYNQIIDKAEEKINYVTIVLLRKLYDNTWHLSYNAVIFSHNLNYLDSPSIRLLYDCISHENYDNEIAALKQKVLRESEKSAKAAIMSRNMSHNLGSHVMAYLKQKLGSVASILNPASEVLKNLYPSDSVQVKDVELPFLVGMGRFLGYLQERQDYIATISTDYIPSGTPVNLKDAIYDELNPDLRYMRHKKSPEKNRPMNILLDYIAKSEGLSRENMVTSGDNIYSTENDILFGFVRYYLEDKTIKKSIFGQGLTQKTMGSDNDALSVMRKINFNLPGGLIGRQALFSIIENLIRNAAKHGDICGNLCFTFDVLDAANLESELALDSRIGEDWLPLYLNATDRDQYYILTITDNLKYPTSLAEKLRVGLEEDYIDPITGVMKESNKGLKEIRISASWLRGETDEGMYQKFGHPDSSLLLPLVGIEVTKNDNHLRYLFALRKNHNVAVVMEGLNSTDQAIFSFLGKDSPIEWTLCNNITDYKDHYTKECFRYILVPNKQSYESIRPYAPNRVIVWDAEWCEEEEKRSILNSLATTFKSTIDSDKLIFNQCKQTIYSQIYQLFAPESTDDFFVFDNASEECHLDESVFPKIKFGESKIDLNNVQSHIAKYVYRTHHATQSLHALYWRMRHGWEYNKDTKIWSQLPEYSKDSKLVPHAYSNIVAIDGITGDNSSDRLVRREPLTEEWYYSHLRALKTRVAIFDERIFKIVHNIDERVFLTPSASDVNAVIKMIQLGDENNPLYNTTLDRVFTVNKAELLSFIELTTIEDKIAFLKRQIKTDYKQSFYSSNTQSAAYHDKLVDVFTVIKGAFDDFVVIGCVSCGCTNDASVINNEEGKIYHYIFDKVATITKDQNRIVTTINSEYKDLINYDLLSIHQGLLDKIYEGFGIKDYDEGANDDNKRMVTESIFKGFITRASIKTIDCKYESVNKEAINECFLPGMVIHSGRSKPTRVDMPQHLPFVQYSAIEHAVKDCKFNLVEILDYAKYE